MRSLSAILAKDGAMVRATTRTGIPVFTHPRLRCRTEFPAVSTVLSYRTVTLYLVPGIELWLNYSTAQGKAGLLPCGPPYSPLTCLG